MQKIRMNVQDSMSDSETSTNWDNEVIRDSLSETDSHYSSQDSPELSDFSTSDEFEDSSESHRSNRRRTDSECSSSTSDTYGLSDDEMSTKEEFFDSSSCSMHNTETPDNLIEIKSINSTCPLPKATSNSALPKFLRNAVVLAGLNEQESEGMGSLFESHRKSGYFSKSNSTNVGDMEYEDTHIETSRETDTDLKVDTEEDNINDPANFLGEEQCWMKLDILMRLKEILHEIVRDYKKNGAEVCIDVEERIREIMEAYENLLKEPESPEVLGKIENQISQNKPAELETPPSTSKTILKIPESEYSYWNHNDEHASDCDSSDSCDEIDGSEEFKKHFEKYETFIARVKLSGKPVSPSWRNEIDDQQRKNWVESVAYTAATQVELKPGKEIDKEGLRRFGESIEWEVFHGQANSAVEYSNILCDKHDEIGHGRMSDAERDYLMFLAYKK